MDSCYSLLRDRILNDHANFPEHRVFIWLDENCELVPEELATIKNKLTLVCNRIDVHIRFSNAGFDSQFSDFNIDKADTFNRIYLRVSKEKLVCHHCLNTSMSLLASEGEITLIGRKEDGIKSLASRCQKKLMLSGSLKKHGNSYLGSFKKTALTHEALNDESYLQLRQVAEQQIDNNDYKIFSKPGVYGWKKIDQGSHFLIQTLLENKQLLPKTKKSALDLGCGSGYLTLLLHALAFSMITATDNNAAAIIATKKTCAENNIQANVAATDCGATLTQKFDLIICNPPFHKGFNVEKQLTKTFVQQSLNLMATDGCAFFVTNVFVGIEALIKSKGHVCNVIANNGRFKVMHIRD